jgi:LysM repeat protein
MHDHGRPRFARLLAPLALIAIAVVVVAMVLGSGVVGDDSGDNKSASTGDLPTATERTTTAGRKQSRRATYTIKAGDTLTGIAAKTGTTVERLQELNPELDAEALVAGQKIKLRE